MNRFHTRSHSMKNVRVMLYVYIVEALLSLLGLKIALVTCLFFEAIFLICALMCIFLVSRTYWILDFDEGGLLLKNNANKKEYYLEGISAANLDFRQSERQIKKDRCDLIIADTPFCIYDVEKCNALKKYVYSAYKD